MPTIVAIGAHHDDVELRCGGTLAVYRDRGWDVAYAVACTTPHVHPGADEALAPPRSTTAAAIRRRKQEARRGAETLGISDVTFFDFKSLYWYQEGTYQRRFLDGHHSTPEEFTYLNASVPGREFLVTASRCPAALAWLRDFLVRKKADIVLTHFPDDAHWEHYATAAFVCKAVRALVQAGRAITLYAWEPGGAGPLTASFAPTHYVDITAAMDRKCAALLHFRSQFRNHDPTPFSVRARNQARESGRRAGVGYAEPFVRFADPGQPAWAESGRRRQPILGL